MSWKVHETDEVFAALRGLCSNTYRMYDPCEHRHYYDHDCETYECAVEDAAREYGRLLKHCNNQREQLAKRSCSQTIDILMELLNEYQESECAIAEDRVTYYADRLDGRTEDEQMDERTRTEQNGVGITDELREYVDQKDGWGMTHTHAKAIAAIADSIDEQHAVKVERLEKYRAAVCAMLKEYVKLPMDADGVPIRVGDSVALGDGTFEVRRLELYDRDSWDVLDRFGEPFSPLNLRHVQPDSWECIIHDATGAGWMGEGVFDEKDFERIEAELVERCKRLAGDAE